MSRRIKVRKSSKPKCMVSMVQEMNANIPEDGIGVCIWNAKHIISFTGCS